MIDITIYRARIGSHAFKTKKKKTDLSNRRVFHAGGIIDCKSYLGLHPVFVLYLYVIICIAAMCMSMICGLSTIPSRYYIATSLPASFGILTNTKLWFCMLFCHIFLHFYRAPISRYCKRHARILAYLGYTLFALNFLLITIINPSLLNPGPKNFSIYYQNVQGFVPIKDLAFNNPSLNHTKLLEFQNYVFTAKPSIIALNETWLKPSIRDNEILPDTSYKIFRVDRSVESHPPDPNNPRLYKRNGGGVLLAIRTDYNVTSKIVKLKCNAEILTLKISMGNKIFYFCTCYRVGTLGLANHAEIDRYLNSLYSLDKKFAKVFFIGDVNFNNANWSTMASSCHIEQHFLNTFSNLGMVQLITEPTHKHGNILDVLLTNSVQSITNLCVADKDAQVRSDHYPITFDIILNIKKKKSVKRKIFNFKRANWADLNKDLSETNWNDLLRNKSSKFAWTTFKSKLNELSIKHIPQITISSEFQPPWFDSDCHNLCRKKERWHTKFKQTKKEEHYFKFAKCRREFKKLVQCKMRDNLIDVEGDPALIPKKFWSFVKSTSNSHRIPECMNYNSKFRTDRKDQCELFNEFFYDQFSTPSIYNIADCHRLYE